MRLSQIIDGSAQREDLEAKFDAIIIGSGAGGAVLAKELAEGGLRVALLEEGGYHPLSEHRDLAYQAVRRLYRDRGFTTTLGKPTIPVPLGRALGGTTVINSGTCFRTPTRIFEHWQKDLGLTALDEAEFEPMFERIEKELNVTESEFEVMSRANTLIHEILLKKGIAGKPLKRNVRGCDGCGFCCYGCTSGAKQSMDVSYIPKALNAGAVAYTNTKFSKLLHRNKKVIGVEGVFLNRTGRRTSYRIRLKAPLVVMAAGTLLTPQLLKQNGVATKNKNLGRNITIHPATKVFARFKEEIRGWEGTPQSYYLDLFSNEGIMFEGIFVPPDIAAITAPFIGKQLHDFMRDYGHMASFGFLIEDSSTGRIVKLPFLGPTIFYRLNKIDLERIKKGVAFLARTFLEGGADKVYSIIHGHTELNTIEQIEALEKAELDPGDVECMAFHPLGSCRMGASPESGVVDTNNAVFGWEGLYVCDGSIIPSSLGVNPQITIMAFATRLAYQILGKRAERAAQDQLKSQG